MEQLLQEVREWRKALVAPPSTGQPLNDAVDLVGHEVRVEMVAEFEMLIMQHLLEAKCEQLQS